LQFRRQPPFRWYNASRCIAEIQTPHPSRRQTLLLNPSNLPITRRSDFPSHNLAHIDRSQARCTNSRDPPPEANGQDEREIKIPTQERDAAKVEGRGAEDAEDHYGVPGRDFRGDHDQLIDDEHCEGDGNHALEAAAIGLRRGRVDWVRSVESRHEELAAALDDAALVDGDGDPDEEGPVGETLTRREFFVELRG